MQTIRNELLERLTETHGMSGTHAGQLMLYISNTVEILEFGQKRMIEKGLDDSTLTPLLDSIAKFLALAAEDIPYAL